VIKLAYRIVSFFWIISPIIFMVMRCMGVYDFGNDSLVFVGLAMISTFAMFMTYKSE